MEKIPEQKHVSWGVTFNVSWAGIRRRFFRSLVTMSGVVLAIAFLTYMQIMNKIVNALIEALAISQGFNPEGGTKNFHFSTENSHSELCNYLKVVRGFLHPRDGFFLRAESASGRWTASSCGAISSNRPCRASRAHAWDACWGWSSP